jgi:hypothetical protein
VDVHLVCVRFTADVVVAQAAPFIRFI